jgi:hypothetical protein
MKFTIPKLPLDATAFLARLAELRQRAAALSQSADPAVRQLLDEQPALKALLAQGEKVGRAAEVVKEALRQLAELAKLPAVLLPVVPT